MTPNFGQRWAGLPFWWRGGVSAAAGGLGLKTPSHGRVAHNRKHRAKTCAYGAGAGTGTLSTAAGAAAGGTAAGGQCGSRLGIDAAGRHVGPGSDRGAVLTRRLKVARRGLSRRPPREGGQGGRSEPGSPAMHPPAGGRGGRCPQRPGLARALPRPKVKRGGLDRRPGSARRVTGPHKAPRKRGRVRGAEGGTARTLA